MVRHEPILTYLTSLRRVLKIGKNVAQEPAIEQVVGFVPRPLSNIESVGDPPDARR